MSRRPPKKRSLILDYAVYVAVRLGLCFLQALSFEAACSLARGVAWLAFRLDRRRRGVARDNIAKAFPGRYDEGQLDELVRASYLHFARVMMEVVHIPRK